MAKKRTKRTTTETQRRGDRTKKARVGAKKKKPPASVSSCLRGNSVWPSPPAPAVDAAVQALALVAIERERAGKKVTARQAKALDRVRAVRDHDAKWAAFRSITAADWKAMAASGGHTLSDKVRNDQAARHGIPFGGPVIDLATVVAGLHRFLADNAQRLGRDDADADPSLREAQRRRAIAQADREELARDRERGQTIDCGEHDRIVDGLLDAIATLCEQAGVELARRLAPLAKKKHQAAIEAYFDEVRRRWAGSEVES